MSQIGSLKYAHLAYLSQPAADRIIYRAIHKQPVRNIVEMGVGDAVRAQRVIAMASGASDEEKVHYTGIDFFEQRPASAPGTSLKDAYCMLRQLHATVRLVPGDPSMALARTSNHLADTDLLIIAADQDPEALSRAWMFVPRMIHDDTLVFLQKVDDRGQPSRFVRLSVDEVDELAGCGIRGTRIAA